MQCTGSTKKCSKEAQPVTQLMRVGSEGYSVWSDPIEKLLYLKLIKIVHTVQHNLCMEVQSCRAVRVPRLTLCPPINDFT